MIKNLRTNSIITTPIIASQTVNLNNTNNLDVLLLETGSGDINNLAWEYLDYFNYSGIGEVQENSQCSIALETPPDDRIRIREGKYITTPFNAADEVNLDGTYKRLVYHQIYNLFYNSYKNPLKICGVENIDFDLSKTYRYIDDDFLIFNISPSIFGDKIVPSSVSLTGFNLDDNITLQDDGYENINAGTNIFYRIQEVRKFGNIISSGSSGNNINLIEWLPANIDATGLFGYTSKVSGLVGVTNLQFLQTSNNEPYDIENATGLISLSFPALNYLNGNSYLKVTGCSSLTFVNIQSLISSSGNITIKNNATLSRLTLPPVLTLNTAGSVDLSLNILNQASVDGILVALSRGSTSTGTFNASGGSNATTSSLGHGAALTLISRGWTITTN